MNTIRKIVHLTGRELRVILPEQYAGLEVEVIIRPAAEATMAVVNESSPNYESLYGSIKLGSTIEQIDAQLKRLRKEWDRDIS